MDSTFKLMYIDESTEIEKKKKLDSNYNTSKISSIQQSLFNVFNYTLP